MYLHIFICTCMYMSMYEYPYFDYIVFYVHIEKEEKFTQKKEIFQENQNFIELLPSARPPTEIEILSLPSARPPTEIEILSVLVIIS